MSDVIVKDLDEATIEKLKIRADQHGRSLEEEARFILEQVATSDAANSTDLKSQAWQRVHQARQGHAGQTFNNSVELLREDRNR
jgi:antitoxin FitA